MKLSKSEVNARALGYINAVSEVNAKYHAEHFSRLEKPVIDYSVGSRYIRVIRVSSGSRSVHSFVDRSNGNILKAASWRAPEVKNPRGNIFDPDFGAKAAGVGPYGVRYLVGGA